MMDPGNGALNSDRPNTQRKRSYTTVPNSGPSHVSGDHLEPKKSSHRHHHSHHHLPRRHGHGKESQLSRVQHIVSLDSRSGHSDTSSANGSRRESLAESGRQDRLVAPAVVRPEDLARERQRIDVRNMELRSTLQTLSENSLKTTRELDDVYYSILEKVSVLAHTISTLQELSSLTRQLHEGFQGDARELESDIKSQIDGFEGFEKQKDTIEGYEKRMQDSKAKINDLTERLERARSRVQRLEKREGEWQATVSRRIKMMWIIFVTIGALVVGILIANSFRLAEVHEGRADSTDYSPMLSSPGVAESVKDVLHQIYDNITSQVEATEHLSSSSKVDVKTKGVKEMEKDEEVEEEEDPRLSIFEEL
ncbi:hypothetical protein EJ08DRAFT_371999 [Tothia fuscella]|uniref:Uncharacterized protein n=1 Tax=Tothia fuscella TaxID=1048955 RepID=A0A9P4TWC0_9PEZI|nr:hypothetical protein EJ08DRAFT_371999 [Tothia fuscella]